MHRAIRRHDGLPTPPQAPPITLPRPRGTDGTPADAEDVGAGVEVLEEDGEGDDDFADFFLYDKWTFCFWLSGLLALVPGV